MKENILQALFATFVGTIAIMSVWGDTSTIVEPTESEVNINEKV